MSTGARRANSRPYHFSNYGAFITTDDFVMANGMSLERRGVVPDERVPPTPQDLRAGRDPALARALEIAGHPITAEKAGELFPVEWEK